MLKANALDRLNKNDLFKVFLELFVKAHIKALSELVSAVVHRPTILKKCEKSGVDHIMCIILSNSTEIYLVSG